MKKQKGFIALTSVLVLSALFLSLSIGVSSRAIGATQIGIASSHAASSEYMSNACAQYALMQIANQLHYIGNETLLIDGNECDINAITEDADGTRTIQTQADVSGYVYRVVVEVSAISPDVAVDSYQSVKTF